MFNYLVMIVYNLAILTPFIVSVGVLKFYEKNYCWVVNNISFPINSVCSNNLKKIFS